MFFYTLSEIGMSLLKVETMFNMMSIVV